MIICGIILTTASCSDSSTEPAEIAGAYQLVEYRGSGLPATIPGASNPTRVLSGTITLTAVTRTAANDYADFSFTRSTQLEVTTGGAKSQMTSTNSGFAWIHGSGLTYSTTAQLGSIHVTGAVERNSVTYDFYRYER